MQLKHPAEFSILKKYLRNLSWSTNIALEGLDYRSGDPKSEWNLPNRCRINVKGTPVLKYISLCVICIFYEIKMIKIKQIESFSSDVWRVFISGSSSAGKTYFAKQLLNSRFFQYDRIYYYHPDIQEDFPIDWGDLPVICQAGLPTLDDLLAMPPYSVVILDDLYTEACKEQLMSYLFRVLSSKKKLHLMIMTQRYFAEGSIGLIIRNCSNYQVLMRNADERTNVRVGYGMNLTEEIKTANEINQSKLYPYIFIDRTNEARVSGVQVYTDIFSREKQIIQKNTVLYLIPANDFKEKYDILDSSSAKLK